MSKLAPFFSPGDIDTGSPDTASLSSPIAVFGEYKKPQKSLPKS
jgi:hypothetical protein